jgi:hypothetical protein
MKATRNRNTIMRIALCLPMAALLITTAIAGPEKAKKEVPFKGVIDGTLDFTFDIPNDELIIAGSGGGEATHLGRFTGDVTVAIDLTNPDVGGVVMRTFVAADGSELYAEGPGVGSPPPNQFVVEELIITGGTGRFEGASGSFTLEHWVYDVAPPFIDLVTEGSFDGTIILK